MALLLLDAGGTITSVPNAQGHLSGATGEDRLGGLAKGIRTRQIYTGLSEEMSFADMARLRDAVLEAESDPAVSGIVVAHGTDAMEESAYLVDLSVACAKPVIFTGAQRAPSIPESDGPANLGGALAAAATPGLAPHGVLVAFGGRLIPAALVYKRSTTRLDGFASRIGVEGQASADAVIAPPLLPRAAPLPPAVPCGDVHTIALAGASDGRLIDAAVAMGARGVVLMALGRGNASAEVCAAVARAVAAGMAVAITSRCPDGTTGADYATGQKLAEAGAVFGNHLGPSQARILLSCLLAGGGPATAVSGMRERACIALPA